MSLPDIFKVISFGSIWEIDLLDMRYRRYPKKEAPRENSEWSDERAGALQDFTWHVMTGEPFLKESWAYDRLAIPFDKERIVTAPISFDEFERLKAMGLKVR